MDLSNPTPRWRELRDDRPNAHAFLSALAQAEFETGKTGVPLSAIDAEGLGEAENEGVVDWQGDENDLVSFASDDLRREYLVRHGGSLLQENWGEGPEAFASAFRDVSDRAVQVGGIGGNVAEAILLLLSEEQGERILSYLSTLARRDNEREANGHTPFWTLYRHLTKILHRLEVGPEEVAQHAAPILKASSDDEMGGQLYGAVKRMARQSEERANALYETLISHSDPPVQSLASTSLVGLSTRDFTAAHRRALQLTGEESPILRRIGITALGQIDYQDQSPKVLRDTWECLEELQGDPNKETDYVLARCLGNLLTVPKDVEEMEEIDVPDAGDIGRALAEIASRPDPNVQHAVSRVLFLHREDYGSEEWYETALLRIAGVPSTHGRTVRHIEGCLRRYLEDEDPYPERALAFLREFVLRRPDDGEAHELLSGVFSSLRQNFFEELQAELTRWLASSETSLHRGAADMYQYFDRMGAGEEESGRRFHLSKDVLDDLEEEEVVNVVKRACGHVAGGGRLLADLVISALCRESPSDELSSFVGYIMTEHVLYNYPEGGRDALEDYVEDEGQGRITEIARKALEQSGRYYEELRDLPRLKEFRPPSRRRYLLRRALHDQQTKIKEQAWEQSDIMKLVSRQPLKYGRSFFSDWGPDGFSDPSPLRSISHAPKSPRGANIDPIGMEYRRFLWRRAGLVSIEPESEGQTEHGGAE